jgi:hypothetical protein
MESDLSINLATRGLSPLSVIYREISIYSGYRSIVYLQEQAREKRSLDKKAS